MLLRGEEYVSEAKATMEEYALYHRDKLTELFEGTRDMWRDIEYLAFETLSSFEEADAILGVLIEENIAPIIRDKKIWISFSCGDGSVTRMDGNFRRVLGLPTVSTLWGIGLNCVGIDIAAGLAKDLAQKLESKDLSLVLYPDAGKWHGRTTAQFTYSPTFQTDGEAKEWARLIVEVRRYNGGRVVLRGCCHTDPRFVSALVALLSR
jgi:S-methylmethionine-dependent homocysteine/selenocysteine methylase